MFGYVKEYAPELKVKDYALYKAVYCGLCKSMGKCCGVCSRLTLSYDITFLAIVRMALCKTEYKVAKSRCIVHPFKKRPALEQNSELEYSARVSALLSYAKLMDDIADTKGIKKLFYIILKPFFGYAAKKAGERELFERICGYLKRLDIEEKNGTESIDVPADIFGELTGDIFSSGLEGNEKKIAYSIGFYTGKWIYAADALDDMADDARTGSYNPFVLLYGSSISEKDAEIIKSAFVHSLTEIEKAAFLIDFTDASLEALIYNIIYEGMKRKSDSITEKILCKAVKD